MINTPEEFQILLVEDSSSDAALIREILEEGDSPIKIHHVVDGRHAMAFLRREGSYAHSPKPNIVLLDLNTPRMDGREVLQEIKSDPILRSIPVIALTTSSYIEDVRYCYQAGANAFITKPVDLDEFISCLKNLQAFWLSDVTLL